MGGRIAFLLFPTFANAKQTLDSSAPARSRTPRRPRRKWTQAEDDIVLSLVQTQVNIRGRPRWSKIAESLPGRSKDCVRSRYVYSISPDIKRGQWREAEDELLVKEVQELTDANRRLSWVEIASALDGRTPPAVRDRWMNTLNPEIKRGRWTKAEDELLTKLVRSKVDENGCPQWAEIACSFVGRTGSAVRYRWTRSLNPYIKHGSWTKAEDSLLHKLVQTMVDEKGRPQWTEIANAIECRTEAAVFSRYESTLNPNIKRGSWTKAEDELLIKLVQVKVDEKGHPQWVEIARSFAGRTRDAVRQHWTETLSPKIKRDPWTKTEDALLVKLVMTMVDEKGRPQWAEIAGSITGRTSDAVQKRWEETLNPYVKRGPWTKSEDALLAKLVQTMVDDRRRPQWSQIGKVIGRSGSAIQKRWTRSVNPEIKRGRWTEIEDEHLIKLIRTEVDGKGRPLWTKIGGLIGGRLEGDVRRRWLVHLSPKDKLD